MQTKTDVIILAAGQGKRMHQAFPGTPKVLVPMRGKAMLLHVLDAVEASGVASRIIVVVGPAVEKKVRRVLVGRKVIFVLQPEPNGTGHAVLCAREILKDAENVLVLYGDQPFVSAKTIKTMVKKHAAVSAPITMLTVPLPDFLNWRSCFADFSRIIRNKKGKMKKSVEVKDASGTELHVTEVNPSFYCFNGPWLWKYLPKVGCSNAQCEYYLPDVLRLAIDRKEEVNAVPLKDPREALGANTPEQLAVLEAMFE